MSSASSLPPFKALLLACLARRFPPWKKANLLSRASGAIQDGRQGRFCLNPGRIPGKIHLLGAMGKSTSHLAIGQVIKLGLV